MTERVTTALEDRVVAVVAAGPEDGSRFVEVLVRLPDHLLPADVFECLRVAAAHGRLEASELGTVERPMSVRYRLRRPA